MPVSATAERKSADRAAQAAIGRAAAAMPPYLLTSEVHLCVGPDRIILLDLARNAYLALPLSEAAGLSNWIRAWPLPGSTSELPQVVEELLHEGMLTVDEHRGHRTTPVARTCEPREALGDVLHTHPLTIRARHVRRFFLANLFAVLMLRLLPLRQVIGFARRLKSRAGPIDRERVTALIATFDALYPWFFTRRDECLKNSFALLLFLAWYRIVPDWVFGVRAVPFAAHCWLQHEGLVLNDSIQNTASRLPIMVV